jgi:putative DNA methylase
MTEPYRKKLIEVALPLEAINRESSREKSIRHGHPSTLHLWWARRPLAACRAVLFASIVDDPSSRPDLFPTEEEQEAERQRLFRLIEELVKWENSNNEEVFGAARAEILKSTDGNPPPVLDPFCGGGSIPLEAQRLGLEAHASDLNPVAVMITKVVVEIPSRIGGGEPVNPDSRSQLVSAAPSSGAKALAEDVRFYGMWLKEEAGKRLGGLFAAENSAEVPVGWLWARTVRCRYPACQAQVPLLMSFLLARRARDSQVWAELDLESGRSPRFKIKSGHLSRDEVVRLSNGTAAVGPTGRRLKATFLCPFCKDGVVKGAYVDTEASHGGIAFTPVCLIVEGNGRKQYREFGTESSETFASAVDYLEEAGLADAVPDQPCRGTFASNAQGLRYGFVTYADYFTPRQQAALMTFAALIPEVVRRIEDDARAAGLPDDRESLEQGGTGARAYAEAISATLALVISRCADYWSSLATWANDGEFVRNTFSVPGIPMAWDFIEVNPLSSSTGSFENALDWAARVLQRVPGSPPAFVDQLDATAPRTTDRKFLVATDPPYYANVSYAALSDYFYVWLRRMIGSFFPNLAATMLTPQSAEIVATPFIGDGERSPREHFRDGMSRAFARMYEVHDPRFPVTVFYALKEAEEAVGGRDGGGLISTGWETMLEALIEAGFAVVGTWPMRTERGARSVGIGTNALASSVVMTCRARSVVARVESRAGFIRALRAELPAALRQLQRENIAPVDLAQASIGPGMAVFSRYEKVIEADGSQMSVRTALGLINRSLDELLAEQEGDFDPDTRFAVAWFEQFGMDEADFGHADSLARAKNTAVNGLQRAGVLVAGRGKARLVRRDELDSMWNPATDDRLTIWETTQHLVWRLQQEGESETADLLRRVGDLGETARELAYRLYGICERKGWAQEALGYNALVVAWPELARLANEEAGGSTQQTLEI